MTPRSTRTLSLTQTQRYSIAVLGVMVTAIARLLLDPLLKDDLPLFLFTVPITVACWAGGLWPGLLATSLSLLLGNLFRPGASTFHPEPRLDVIQTVNLGFIGTTFSILFDRIRKASKAELLQQIIDVAPSLVYIYNLPQKKCVFINRAIASELDYAPAPNAPQAEFVRSVMHTDDWEPFLHHLERLADLKDEETAKFEYRMRHSSGDWRWFHSRDKVFTRNEDGSVREIMGTATDVTERKNAEAKTKFMADLNEAFFPLADPAQIMDVAVRRLGEFLGVDRCGYAEVDLDEDHFVVMGEYIRGPLPKIVGRYRMSDFGDNERRILRENHPYVVNDIEAEPPEGADLSLYRRGAIRSLVCVPLNKGGQFMARMAVHQSTPRHWSSEEIQLITAVANRCWESVERAKAIRSLQESDERYRAFIANSSEAIWRFELEQPIPIALPDDEQFDMLYKFAYLAECNDAMARMYGYESAAQIIGARLGDLLIKTDVRNIASFRALKSSGYRLTDFETHELDRYGNTKYFLNNLIGIQEKGAIVRAWGTQRDITHQKHAEDALRQSQDRLRRITDATQDALWEIDLKTNQLWWSEGARPLFGRSSGELQIGLEDWYRGIHPEDVARVGAKFEAFMSGDATDWSDEYRFRRADDSYVFIHDRGRKFYGESRAAEYIAGAMVDITERKRAEEALRESEERFSKAFRASPDALVISRIADGVVLEVNDSFVLMSGYSRDELIGKSTVPLGLYVDPSVREKALAILKQQKYVRDFEFTMRRRSGEERLVSFSAQPLDLRGEHCWLTIGHDITERRQAERERERLLMQEKAAREEAETASRLKDEFLATISHELRTPLTAILGWSRILTDSPLSESQTRRGLQVIAQSASSQARLVDDILDSSRIITGRLKLHIQPVDIERVFQAAIDVIRPSAEAKRITLKVVIDHRDGIVRGDANRLQQVIWNLLSNAVKFTNEGGRVEARLSCTAKQFEISVSDTGIGIEPEFLPYIFDRFRQADSTSTRRYGGLGLGLAIVRHLVEMHGGTVSASTLGAGRGSTFKVTFPAASPPCPPEHENREGRPELNQPVKWKRLQERQKLAGVRVLVAEDDPDTLEMLGFIFRQSGAEVIAVASTSEALRVVDRWQPDILVSDLAMPDLDGYALIKQLRARGPERGGNVPAVALSAYTRPEDRAHALSAGFQMHVAKPIDPENLIGIVASLTRLITH
jgi:PAS domain S-box-containing protein